MRSYDFAAANRLAFDAWRLWLDAGQVVWLRSLRLMEGGSLGENEAERMVTEKVAANLAFWPAMWMAGPASSPETMGRRAIAHYSRPVRANRRRLTRSR